MFIPPIRVLLAAGALLVAFGTSCGTREGGPAGEASAKAQPLLSHGLQFLKDAQDDEAVRVLEEARRLDPGSPDIAIVLSRAYLRVKRYAAARELLEETLGSRSATRSQKIEARRFLVESHLWEGNLDRAREACQPLIREEPDSAMTHRLVGTIAYRMGDLGKARIELVEAVRIDPDDSEALTTLGVVLLQSGEFGGAVTSLEKAVRLNPGDLPALSNLAKAYERLGRREEAQATRARLDEARGRAAPSAAPAPLRARAEQAYNAGRLDEALGYFQELLKSSPRDPQLLSQIGMILTSMQRLDEAEGYLNRSLQVRPEDEFTLTQLGRLHALRNDLPRAIEILQRASRANPSAPEPHYYLAAIYYTLKRKEEFLKERAAYDHLRTASSDSLLMPLPGDESR